MTFHLRSTTHGFTTSGVDTRKLARIEWVHGKRPLVTSDSHRLQNSPRKLLFASFYKKGSNLTWNQELLSTHHFNYTCRAPECASTKTTIILVLLFPSYHQIHTSTLWCCKITLLIVTNYVWVKSKHWIPPRRVGKLAGKTAIFLSHRNNVVILDLPGYSSWTISYMYSKSF